MQADPWYDDADSSLPARLVYRAFASLDQSVVAIDLTGAVRHWNAGAERLYGYSRAEALGRSVSELIVPSARSQPPDWPARLRAGQLCSGDWELRDRTGRPLTVSVVSAPVLDDDGAVVGLIGVSTDVSGNRREQARAHELTSIVAEFHDALLETDLHGVVVHANPAVEAVYGYPPAELVGTDIRALVVTDATVDLADRSGAVQQVKIRRRDGSVIDIVLRGTPVRDQAGQVVGIRLIGRDVTADVRNLAALDASERRFRVRFDQTPVPQALVSPEGRLESVNDALCRLLGLDCAAVRGTPIWAYAHPDAGAQPSAPWRALLAGDIDMGSWEHLLADADGRELPVLIHGAVLRGPDGAPESVAVYVEDLSGVRRVERELTRQDALMAALTRHASESAVVLDATGVIRYISAAVAVAGGLNPDEVAGKAIWDRVHPDDLPAVRRAFDAVVATAGGTDCVDFRALDPAGGYLWFEAAYTNHLDDPDVNGIVCIFRDVTQRVSDARALRESEARYRAIAETAQEGIWAVDLTGRTWYANQRTADLLGVALDEVYGRNAAQLIDPGGTAGFADRLHAGRDRGQEQVELTYRRPDGSARTLRLSVSELHDELGRTGLLAMIADVTETRLAEEQLRRRALYDDLTGLPNRTLLGDRLQQAVTRPGRGPVALLFADLDQFRMVNESRGHVAGDALLVQVAARLRAALGADGTVARFGGDKFAVVCEGASEVQARALADRLQRALAVPFEVDGQRAHLTAGVGVAVSPPNQATGLLRFAETAMYSAKALGAGRVATFDRILADEAAQRVVLSNDLRDALQRDELTLHYQPIVDLADGRVIGCEALARWQHPTRGAIPPATFVGFAESTGLAAALNRWALTRACREADQLIGVITAPAKVSVNISARQLTDLELEATVLAAVDGSVLADGGLNLEITETAVMGNPDEARQLLQRLRKAGVQTAIDDFGTGYSSLAYLSRLPVSTLKIDRSFIADITTNADSLAITASVIKLAHTMRLSVVAEGIETADQLALLRRLGCTAGQGYLFSRALPPAALVQLVDQLPGGRFDVRPPESVAAGPTAAGPTGAGPDAGRPALEARSGDGAIRRPLPRPAIPGGIDPTVRASALEATRALLYAATPREVVDVVIGLVRTLGAVVVPARQATPNTMPLDLSFGVTEPVLAVADPAGVTRLHLEMLLPTFLEDARQVIMALRDARRLRDEASYDPVTGLPNRWALDRRLHRLRPGDALAMIDLDHFKRLNDTAGHAAGDAVLTAFGRLMRDHAHADDVVARYGGDEVLIGLPGAGPEVLRHRVEQLRRTWRATRPYPVTFSAGVSALTTTVDAALHNADRAMYLAKRAGRDRTEVLT